MRSAKDENDRNEDVSREVGSKSDEGCPSKVSMLLGWAEMLVGSKGKGWLNGRAPNWCLLAG